MKKILIIDGQGGRIGKTVIERIADEMKNNESPAAEIYAVGTNSVASSNMMTAARSKNLPLKAATGENPIVVLSKKADVICGPIGIIIADSMLGEITPNAASAVSSSSAVRVLIPMNMTGCDNFIAGVGKVPLADIIDSAVMEIMWLIEN